MNKSTPFVIFLFTIVVQSCYTPNRIPKNLNEAHLILEDSDRKYYTIQSENNTWKLNEKVGYHQDVIQVLNLKNHQTNQCLIPNELPLNPGTNRWKIDCQPKEQSFALKIEKDTLLTWLKENDDEVLCKGRSKRNFEDFMLINNQWGIWKLKTGELKLCMYSTLHDNRRIYAWEWDSPSNARGVIGYPEVKLLNKPSENSGLDANANRPNLPLKIADLKKLEVEYDSEIFTDKGKFNIAFDLWITEKKPDGKHEVRYEFMVWEKRQDFNSFGKKRGVISTPFGDYMLQTGFMDKTDEVGRVWNYIAFVRTSGRTNGKVDLKYLIDKLVGMGELPDNLYINSVELGTEMGNSKGYFLLKDLDLILE